MERDRGEEDEGGAEVKVVTVVVEVEKGENMVRF